MATGFSNLGNDFENIYAPNQSGAYSMPSGYSRNGQDLSFVFEMLSYGSRAPNTNYSGTGRGYANTSDLWAAIGTPQYKLPFDGRLYTMTRSGRTGETGNTTATVSFGFLYDGTWSVAADNPDSGIWVPNGRNASDFSIYIAATLTVDPISSINPTASGTALNAWIDMTPPNSANARIVATVPNSTPQNSEGTLTCDVILRDNVRGGQRSLGVCNLLASANSQA